MMSKPASAVVTAADVSSQVSMLDAKAITASEISGAVSSLRRHYARAFQQDAKPPQADEHDTALSTAGASKKRKRTDDASAETGWRAGFNAFLDKLLLSVVAVRKSKKIAQEDLLELHIDAFSSYAHFMSHGLPLSVHAAQGANGPAISRPVVLRLVQTLLAAGGKEARDLYTTEEAEASPSVLKVHPSVLPYLTSDLETARNTLRSEFCDDYDDARVAILKAVRDCAKERIEHAAAGGSAPVPGEGDSLPRAALLSCSGPVFARNAVDFMLGVTLPMTQAEWDGLDRTSYAADEIGDELQQWARDTGVKLAWDPDSLNAKPNNDDIGAKASGVKVMSAYDSDDEGMGGAESAALKMMQAAEKKLATAAAASCEATGSGTAAAKKAKATEALGPAWASYAEQKKVYAEAWLAVLRCPLPADALRRVLLALPTRLLPLFPGRMALLLADFLTLCVDGGGSTALLAFESLFTLMQGHGLEYPRFYPRLYAILGQPETAAARYKARFFVLLDLFLSSPALPAYLVAAFGKRTARIALTAQPSFARYACALLHNLCVRHPRAMTPLLHRAGAGEGASGQSSAKAASWPATADPFDALTDDPAASHAQDSSLWEVLQLAGHYVAPVAHAARALTDVNTTQRPEVDMAEIAGGDAGAGSAVTSSAAGRPGKARGQHQGGSDLSYSGTTKEELARTLKIGGQRQLADVRWEYLKGQGPLEGLLGSSTGSSGAVSSAVDFSS